MALRHRNIFNNRTGFRVDSKTREFRERYGYKEWSELMRDLIYDRMESEDPIGALNELRYQYEHSDEATFMTQFQAMDRRFKSAMNRHREALNKYYEASKEIDSLRQSGIETRTMGRLMVKEHQQYQLSL